MPADASAAELEPAVRRELQELAPAARTAVAGHLVMAARLLAADPELAYRHAAAARGLAGRLPAVREASGVTAYRTARYADAVRDLRAYLRLTGDGRHLPVIADSERGLGRPDRALAVTGDAGRQRLGPAERVELRIVRSGARRDRGEYDAALVELRGPELDSAEVREWTVRLWYAYAAALLDAGRSGEALRWFRSAAAIDEYGETDAEERVEELERATAQVEPMAAAEVEELERATAQVEPVDSGDLVDGADAADMMAAPNRGGHRPNVGAEE